MELVSPPSTTRNQRRCGKAAGLRPWLKASPSDSSLEEFCCWVVGCAFQRLFVSVVFFFLPEHNWKSLDERAKRSRGCLPGLLREG